MNQYLTIPQAAEAGPVKAYRLRRMLKQGLLPGFYSGVRFFIDYPRFLDDLENICLRCSDTEGLNKSGGAYGEKR